MQKIKETLCALKNYKYSTISGLNEGEKYVLPYFLEEQKYVIVANNAEQAENYQSVLKSLNKRVLCLTQKLPLAYSMGEKNSKIFKDYISVLGGLCKNNCDVLVLTPSVLFQKLPNSQFFIENSLSLKKGENYNLSLLTQKLTEMGYSRQEVVSSCGEFSVRGDNLDIFALDYKNPIRICFFDDEIEEIFCYDVENFKKVGGNLKEVFVSPCSLFVANEELKNTLPQKVFSDMQKAKLDAQSAIRLANIANTQLEYLQNGLSFSSVFFLPFCEYFNATIFDYISLDSCIIVDEPKLITDQIKQIEEDNVSSFLELSLKGEFLPATMGFYNERKVILKRFLDFKLLAYARLISQNKLFESEYCINFICQSCQKYQNRFVDLVEDIKNYLKNNWTIVLSYGLNTTLKKLKAFLDEEGVSYREISNIDESIKQGVYLLSQNVSTSFNFEMQKFLFIGSLALNNKTVLTQTAQIENSQPKFLPKVGDYVVHQVHGVGKCLGIKNLKLTNASRDYIIVEYKDGDILYLPCENADMLSAFVGESSPKCNKIGGTEFFKVKQKVKNSIKEMAFDLIKVYSERLNAKGHKYAKDSYLQTAFENAFEYPYTSDQISAINDIKRDMESGKIMDRLVCGDVGFGKTEVALVSAYKTIQEGKQVAIITPTTILCEQHYNTALSRMKEFMVNVGVINRFKTKKEQDKILYDLKEGKIDLICGTHRLLSNDVKFKDLGLIILDEEQRFGVEDKEKLKNLKKTLNVLTLSATPIPRTLYMSLTGIRDVSFLSTPPKERKKINTTVIDYSDSLLIDACKKELERDGQVLIVYNRVETITNFYAHVRSLLPDVEIGFAHGQMSAKELEKAIFDLYSRKTQILISTVLIENGVDLPYANTLFVIDADKLGLSQLYQLRGRIGRSNIEAYAYFSFERNKNLTETSYKRLDAIMEFNDFGSGYKIALRDLEIRGAGDVLGKLQHGHMQQVGYDMYVKLLNEAVKEIKGEQIETIVESKIDIAKNAYLPQEYISSSENRIEFYTQIAKISSLEDLNSFIEKKSQELGPMPNPTKQLCYVGLIKNLASRLQIKRVFIDEFESKIVFYKEAVDYKFFDQLKKPSVDFVLNFGSLPIITLSGNSNIDAQQQKVIKFLLSLQSKAK